MERVAIMLRPRKDIHERISAAAKELDKPITAWVMDAIMAKLPQGTMATVKKVEPTEAEIKKSVSEQVLTIMEGGQWFLKSDVVGRFGSTTKYELNLALSELIRTGKIKEDAGAEIYRIRRVI